jgi:TrmH family RNA methyltransferase
MGSSNILDNVGIVLVHTKTPGNIGAVARSMMNMGLSRLALVRPPRDRDNEAEKFAAGAGSLIRSAARFATLAEAVAGDQLVIGTSRRQGRLRQQVRSPRDLAGLVVPMLAGNRVAIVFGREVNGLERKDLALCHEIVTIPSDKAFPSLNLSHAVTVIAYELFVAVQATPPASRPALAGAEDLERFFRHLQGTLQDIGFFSEERPDRIMFSLRQLFGRARLEPRDVRILRGILTKVQHPSRPR